jgi:MFS family permease
MMQGSLLTWRERAAVIAVFSGHAGLSLIYDALPPVLVPLAKHYGGGAHGQVIANFASSLPFFGVMLAGLLVGFPVRRWGTRNVLLVALLAFGFLGSVGAVIDQAWLLLLTRFLLGMASGMIVSCCLGHVAVSFDVVLRARMAGWLIAFGSTCGVVFIVIAGYVASAFSWRTPFLLHAVVSAIFLVPVLCMKGQKGAATRAVPPSLRGLRPTLPVFALAATLQGIAVIYQIQLAFLIGEMPFGTPSAIGLIFALIGCAAAAATFAYGRWFVHISPSICVVWGFALAAIGIACSAGAWSFETFVVAIIFFGAGAPVAQAALFTWAMRTSPPDLATKAMGLMYTCLYFGAAAGPAVTAPLPIMLGIRPLFVIIAGGIAAGLLLAVLFKLGRRSPA